MPGGLAYGYDGLWMVKMKAQLRDFENMSLDTR